MKCHSCHQPIRPDLQFCPLCGAAQAESVPDDEQVTQLILPSQDDDQTAPAAPRADADESDSDVVQNRTADWQPASLADIPEEPVTEMFLESDWDPESALGGNASTFTPSGAFGSPGSTEDPLNPPTELAPPQDDEPDPADFERTVIMPSARSWQPTPAAAAAFERESQRTEREPEASPGHGRSFEEPLREQARAPSAPPPATPGGRRMLPIAIGGMLALLLLVGGYLWMNAGSDAPSPTPAAPPIPAPPPTEPPAPVTAPSPPPEPASVEAAPSAPPPATQDALGDQAPLAVPPPPLPAPALEPSALPAPMPKAEPASEAPARPAPRPAPKPAPKPAPATKSAPKAVPAPAAAPEPKPEPIPEPPPAPPPPAAAAVPAWLTSLRAELAVCAEKSFLEKTICREKVRWSRCAPDRWDTVPECAVKNR